MTQPRFFGAMRSPALTIHSIFISFKILYVLRWSPGLFFEEAQYWLWSKFPAWSYYSKPGMIAWTNYMSGQLFGDTEFAIRINAIVCGALIACLVYHIAYEITGVSWRASLASISLIIFPYYWIISLFYTTDTLVTLFWVASIYFLLRLSRGKNTAVLLGLSIGLGILSKYVMVLFVPFMISYVYFYHRKLFNKPGIAIALLLSALAAVPVILWNYSYDWVTLRHVAHLASDSPMSSWSFTDSLKYLGEYLAGQFLAWFWVFLIPFYQGFRGIFRRRVSEADFLLLVPVLGIFLIFLVLAFQSRMEVNWTFFSLPSACVYAAMVLPEEKLRATRIKLNAMAVVLSLVLFMHVFEEQLHISMGIDPFGRFKGWEEMAEEMKQSVDFEKADYLVFDHYRIASVMSFYLNTHKDIFVYSPDNRMTQFDIWAMDNFSDVRDGKAIFIVNEISKAMAPHEFLTDSVDVIHTIGFDRKEDYKVYYYDKFTGDLNDHSGY